MKNFTLGKLSLLLFCIMLFNVSVGQNLESMLIERMESSSMVFPEECTPEDLVILINSSLPDLRFESNMLDSESFKVVHNVNENQYFICHERMKFKLTVSGSNLQSEDIDIFEIDKPLAFRISANIAKGIVNILTNPRNATVIFPDLNNLVLSSNQPITNVSGKYKINIVKAQYKNVDTTIVIPRDAEKTYNIDLVPLFSRVKLDLTTEDNLPFLKAPVLHIDSVRIVLDALVKPGMNLRSFFDDVDFFKLYEGNIIPIKDGVHKIKIEAESYVPYETTLITKKGKQYNVSARLEPIYGYLTVVDKQSAEGANVFLDNQKIGSIPLFKVKTRVGTHKIRFEKQGYIPVIDDSTLVIEEKKITDVEVSMLLARKVNFQTEPSSAEVLVDGKRIGFTPVSATLNAGEHDILFRKSGYATEKISKIINKEILGDEDFKLVLRQAVPLTIASEQSGLQIELNGVGDNKNIAFDQNYLCPTEVPLPYGKYKIALRDEKSVVYRSTITHSPRVIKRSKLPVYSPTSSRLLEANFSLLQPKGLNVEKKLPNTDNFDASFLRIHIFPKSGLSTALVTADYRVVKTDTVEYKTLAPSIIFLNWDWRIGGSILRQLDVNFLGRVKYTPGLKVIDAHIDGFTDVSMLNYFYGIEFSTRISYFNINFRTGMQVIEGDINLWDKANKKYGYTGADGSFIKNGIPLPKFNERWVGSIGISLNGKVNKANHMLRLWNKPLLDPLKRWSKVTPTVSEPAKPKEQTSPAAKKSGLGKLKFW